MGGVPSIHKIIKRAFQEALRRDGVPTSKTSDAPPEKQKELTEKELKDRKIVLSAGQDVLRDSLDSGLWTKDHAKSIAPVWSSLGEAEQQKFISKLFKAINEGKVKPDMQAMYFL